MTAIALRGSMTGSFRLAGSGEDRSLGVVLAGVASPSSLLNGESLEVLGEIDAAGFADRRRARGSLDLRALRRGRLPYELAFTDNLARPCALRATSAIEDDHWIESLSIVDGEIVDASGAEIARALLRFDVRSFVSALFTRPRR